MNYIRFKDMRGRRLQAQDGEIGECTDLLLGGDAWKVRYLVVDTRRWLPGRRVLIAPASLEKPFQFTEHGDIPVHLNGDQIRRSPPLAHNQPVTADHIRAVHAYFGWPVYWGGGSGTGLTSSILLPSQHPDNTDRDEMERPSEEEKLVGQSDQLRSMDDLCDFAVRSKSERVGYIDDFVFDAEDWSVPFVILDSRKWLSGVHHALASETLDEIHWLEQSISIDLAPETVKEGPSFDPKHEELSALPHKAIS